VLGFDVAGSVAATGARGAYVVAGVRPGRRCPRPCLLGWGPLLVVGYAVSAPQHIRWTGSRAWLPALVWSLVGIALGQVAIATGLVFTYLTPLQTQIGGLAGAILVALLVRQYGLETAHREQQTEEALQRSEQRFRALVQYSSDMTVVLDTQGTVTYVSPAAEEMLGRTPEDLIGTVLDDLSPDDLSVETLWGSARQADNEGVIRSEVRFVHADGSIRWHHVTVRNLLDTTAVGALVANHRDVTEERQAKERLAYEASHDLLTGLAHRGAFVQHLQAALQAGEPIQVAGHNLVLGDSIGICLAPPDGEPVAAADLLRRADLAMYQAKSTRGPRWETYLPELEPASRISAEEIRTAVGQGQLFLAYQPIVRLKDQRVVGTEALVRWNHPTRGLVPPSDFIAIAEETGLIGLVGEWALRTACTQLADWRGPMRRRPN
jgi:PAS domain S-box-containing protein